MEDEASTSLDGKVLGNLRVVDLKHELEKRGLSKSGSKKDLVKRLKQQLEFEKLCEERKSSGDLVQKLELDAEIEQNEFVQQYLAQQQKRYAEREREKKLQLEAMEKQGTENSAVSSESEAKAERSTYSDSDEGSSGKDTVSNKPSINQPQKENIEGPKLPPADVIKKDESRSSDSDTEGDEQSLSPAPVPESVSVGRDNKKSPKHHKAENEENISQNCGDFVVVESKETHQIPLPPLTLKKKLIKMEGWNPEHRSENRESTYRVSVHIVSREDENNSKPDVPEECARENKNSDVSVEVSGQNDAIESKNSDDSVEVLKDVNGASESKTSDVSVKILKDENDVSESKKSDDSVEVSKDGNNASESKNSCISVEVSKDENDASKSKNFDVSVEISKDENDANESKNSVEVSRHENDATESDNSNLSIEVLKDENDEIESKNSVSVEVFKDENDASESKNSGASIDVLKDENDASDSKKCHVSLEVSKDKNDASDSDNSDVSVEVSKDENDELESKNSVSVKVLKDENDVSDSKKSHVSVEVSKDENDASDSKKSDVSVEVSQDKNDGSESENSDVRVEVSKDENDNEMCTSAVHSSNIKKHENGELKSKASPSSKEEERNTNSSSASPEIVPRSEAESKDQFAENMETSKCSSVPYSLSDIKLPEESPGQVLKCKEAKKDETSKNEPQSEIEDIKSLPSNKNTRSNGDTAADPLNSSREGEMSESETKESSYSNDSPKKSSRRSSTRDSRQSESSDAESDRNDRQYKKKPFTYEDTSSNVAADSDSGPSKEKVKKRRKSRHQSDESDRTDRHSKSDESDRNDRRSKSYESDRNDRRSKSDESDRNDRRSKSDESDRNDRRSKSDESDRNDRHSKSDESDNEKSSDSEKYNHHLDSKHKSHGKRRKRNRRSRSRSSSSSSSHSSDSSPKRRRSKKVPVVTKKEELTENNESNQISDKKISEKSKTLKKDSGAIESTHVPVVAPKKRLKIKRDNVPLEITPVIVEATKNTTSSKSNEKNDSHSTPDTPSKQESTEVKEVKPEVPYTCRKVNLSNRKLNRKSSEDKSNEPKTKKGKWESFAACQRVSNTISISTDSLKNWFPDFKLISEASSSMEIEPDEQSSSAVDEKNISTLHTDASNGNDTGMRRESTSHPDIEDTESMEQNYEEPTEQGPVSKMIFIQNLVRPFTLNQLKELLKQNGKIVEEYFWIDKIKSKCFVMYETEKEAIKTRNALNNTRWPSSNPKILSVEFSNEEEMEQHKKGNEPPPPKPVVEPPVIEVPEVIEARITHPVDEHKRKDRERRKDRDRSKHQAPVREWDKDKIMQDSPEREHISKEEKSRSSEKKEKKESKKRPAEDTPAKLLDDLFQKTKNPPCIYWLPLTEEQAKEKEEAQKLKKLEREKRSQQEAERRSRGARSSRRSREKENRKSSTRSRSPVSRRR